MESESEMDETKLNDKEVLKLLTEIFTKMLTVMEGLYVEDYLKDSSQHLKTQIQNAISSAENLKRITAKAEEEKLARKFNESDDLSKIPESASFEKKGEWDAISMLSIPSYHSLRQNEEEIFELVLHNSIIDQIKNPLNSLGPLKYLDLIKDDEELRIGSAKKSEITNYLQENYINIKIHNLEEGFAKSSIKSYALKFKKNEMERVFDFIKPRWTIFEKIWFILNENVDEVACLFKQKSFAKPELFVKNFKEAPFEFYLLRNNKSTPKNEMAFQDAIRNCKVYSLLKYKKTKEDFIRSLRRFEKYLKSNGFGEILTQSLTAGIESDSIHSKKSNRTIFSDDSLDEAQDNMQKKIKS